jgi:hypothetical protein
MGYPLGLTLLGLFQGLATWFREAPQLLVALTPSLRMAVPLMGRIQVQLVKGLPLSLVQFQLA